MLLLKLDKSLNNTNLPTYLPTAAEKAILTYSPSAWLEGDSKYIQVSGAGAFVAWVDRVSGKRYVPGRAEVPGLATYGTKTICRFGFRPYVSTSLTANGVLVAEDNYGALSLTGNYTLAVIGRLPLPGAETGSELPGGIGQSGGLFVGSHIDTDYLYFDTIYGTGQMNLRNKFSSPMFTSTGAFDDAAWHSFIASCSITNGSAQIIADGSLLSANTSGIVALSGATNSNVMTIGGAGASCDQSRLIGDVALVIYVPNVAAHLTAGLLSALNTYMAAFVAAMA